MVVVDLWPVIIVMMRGHRKCSLKILTLKCESGIVDPGFDFSELRGFWQVIIYLFAV